MMLDTHMQLSYKNIYIENNIVKIFPNFWPKTPHISEKPPQMADHHPESKSTQKTGLDGLGLVNSPLGW